MPQTIEINPVTRIEGHAKIFLNLDDAGQVTSGHLQVLEIRGFEKLMDRMELFKMPVITARICGVCPVPHHLVSVRAIEHGLGVQPPEHARLLRELLCLGGLLHSHALSTFVLSGPDLVLGPDAPPAERNVFHLLRVNPDLVKKVLRLRSIGQQIVEIVGGRGIHPITAVPGGMAAGVSAEGVSTFSRWGREAAGIIEELAQVLRPKLDAASRTMECIRLPFHSLALSNGGALSFLDGPIHGVSPKGEVMGGFEASDYSQHLIERVQDGSYMKAVRLRARENEPFIVGPLARLNVNSTVGTPKASALFSEFAAKGRPRLSAVDYVEARLIELMYAAERVAQIADGGLSGPLRVECAPREGRYVAAVEAPRGLLVHDYTADANGRIVSSNLIVATQNNYDAINHALVESGRAWLPKGQNDALFNGLEFTLRCFDPCLSCATHIAGRMPMEVIVRRGGVPDRAITRRAEQ